MNKSPGLRILIHLCLLGGVVLSLLPLVYLFAATTRSEDVYNSYLFFAPADEWSLDSFSRLFGETDFLRLAMNSAFVTSATVLVQLFLAMLGGWALASYQFRGKRIIMGLMIGTMMVPPTVLMAANYELIYHIGLMDSHFGIIIPAAVNVFGMFLFRQSMLSIPKELIQSARVDGCGEWGIFWHIALPLSRPMIGAFCLISFMASWNSFLWPQIILQSESLFTLPIGLKQLIGVYKQDQGALMAGTCLAILPAIILFFFLQRDFIAGLTKGAVKG